MKTTLKIGFAAIIAVSALISSCGKYEEGPKISLASKKARVVNTWKLEKFLVNGAEQNIAGYSYIADMKKDGSYIITSSYAGGTSSQTGTWDFSGNKESLIMTPAGGSTAYTSTILRLKSNELWIKEAVGNNTEESHYVSN